MDNTVKVKEPNAIQADEKVDVIPTKDAPDGYVSGVDMAQGDSVTVSSKVGAVATVYTGEVSDGKPVIREVPIYLMQDWVAKFGPIRRPSSTSTAPCSWDTLSTYLLMIVGEEKAIAMKAAFKQCCWTACQDRNGKWYIEAGMNTHDPYKQGYIVTEKPWNDLEESVLP